MNASGSRPCAASQLLGAGGRTDGAARVGGDSGTRQNGDPAAIGLLFAVMTEASLLGLAEEMAGFPVRVSAQYRTGRQRLQLVENSHQRLGRLKTSDVDFPRCARHCLDIGAGDRRCRRHRWSRRPTDHCLEFRDLHPKFLGAPLQIFPREGLGKFSVELIIERNRIVIVEQNEMLPDGQIEPALKDLRVLCTTRNRPDIEDNIWIVTE